MLAEQVVRRLDHGFNGEGYTFPCQQASHQRRAVRLVADQIAVSSRGCAEAGVKSSGHRSRPMQSDTGWQVGIGTEDPVARQAPRRGVEMDNLMGGMDASIRAAGAKHPDGLGGHAGQRRLNQGLHTGAVQLSLPATVVAAVILQSDRNSLNAFRQLDRRGSRIIGRESLSVVYLRHGMRSVLLGGSGWGLGLHRRRIHDHKDR